jgi:hypothetical protein
MTEPSFLRQADYRLREWGLWWVKSLAQGLGHPSRSTLVSALEGSRSTAPFYPKDNERAEEIHQIILDMVHKCPDLVSIIKFEYTENGSQSEKMRRLKIKPFIYRKTLDRGITWVASRITT